MLHKFKKSDIKFIKDEDKVKKDFWTPIISNKHLIEYGIVGNYCMDRCDSTDLFIIIDSYEKDYKTHYKTCLKIIYPRIRYQNGEFLMGQDKSKDDYNKYYIPHLSTCQLKNIKQGCSFYCTCGADEKSKQNYIDSFNSVDEGDYCVYEIEVDPGWYVEYTYDKSNKNNEHINAMDCPNTLYHTYELKN